MINLWPIGVALFGAGAFVFCVVIAANIWVDWEPKRRSAFRPQPLDDWRDRR